MPVGAGMHAVGVAEREVDAGELLVLQDVADEPRELDVGADREFAHAVRVLVGVGVGPERVFEILVGAGCGHQPVLLDLERERSIGEHPEARAQEVADHAVDHQRAVHLARGREDFTAGQVAPLVGADEPARLQPLVVGVERGGEVAAAGRGGAHLAGHAHYVDHLLAQAIDLQVVGAHALTHDLRRDVDHVRVPHASLVHDVGELHARGQLVLLHLHGKDRHLALVQVGRDGRR